MHQLSLDLLVSTAFLTSLVNGTLTRSGSAFSAHDQYLPSYSMDPANPFAAAVSSSYNYSSYFVRVSLVLWLHLLLFTKLIYIPYFCCRLT